MLLPDLSNTEVGAVAESYVKYKLQRWGEIVVRPQADLCYDLVVLRDSPVKIQVKSRRGPDERNNSYKFNTTHRRETVAYKAGDFDILAVVALDIEEVVFVPHTDRKTLSLHPSEFGQGQDFRTWYQMLDFTAKKG